MSDGHLSGGSATSEEIADALLSSGVLVDPADVRARAEDDMSDLSSIYNDCDPGIRDAVIVLLRAGVETFESCQGGDDHSYPEPTVRFYVGDPGSIWRALGALVTLGLPIGDLRITWPYTNGKPTGPYGEVTFTRRLDKRDARPPSEITDGQETRWAEEQRTT